MKRLLLNSPISDVGYRFASAVGWIWGALWSTGRIERRSGLYVFVGMPRWTYRRGGVCVGCCFLTGSRPTDRVLRHESVHREQWKRYGALFPFLVLVAGRNPLTNRFEIEADLRDGGYLRDRTPVRYARSKKN